MTTIIAVTDRGVLQCSAGAALNSFRTPKDAPRSDSINPIRLDIDDLQVTSYSTAHDSIISPIDDGGGFCCTGCDSGCGINPMASSCESGGASSVPNCQ